MLCTSKMILSWKPDSDPLSRFRWPGAVLRWPFAVRQPPSTLTQEKCQKRNISWSQPPTNHGVQSVLTLRFRRENRWEEEFREVLSFTDTLNIHDVSLRMSVTFLAFVGWLRQIAPIISKAVCCNVGNKCSQPVEVCGCLQGMLPWEPADLGSPQGAVGMICRNIFVFLKW